MRKCDDHGYFEELTNRYTRGPIPLFYLYHNEENVPIVLNIIVSSIILLDWGARFTAGSEARKARGVATKGLNRLL